MLGRKNVIKLVVLFVFGCLFFIPAGNPVSAEEASIELACAYFTYQWEFIHDYQGDQPNGKMKFKVRCHDGSGNVTGQRQALEQFNCTPNGNVSFADEVASFDGASYIECSHPQSLQEVLEDIVDRPISMPTVVEYPGFWVKSNAAPTPQTGSANPLVNFAGPAGETGFSVPVLTTALLSGTMETLISGNTFTSLPYSTSEVWNFYYWQSDCDPVAGTTCEMRYQVGVQSLGTSNISFPIEFSVIDPMQFIIGHSFETNTYYNGDLRDVRVDPGCVVPPGPGCTAG